MFPHLPQLKELVAYQVKYSRVLHCAARLDGIWPNESDISAVKHHIFASVDRVGSLASIATGCPSGQSTECPFFRLAASAVQQ
jgi:hypothetical protein